MTALWIIGLVVIIIMVTAIVKIKQNKPTTTLPYESQKTLFSPAERSFLGILDSIMNEDERILGKIRLADVIKVKAKIKDRQRYFNYISSKHLDFVICGKNDLSIRYAIELDDKSHESPARKKRDDFLNRSLEAANIPLIRVKAKRTYNTSEIKNQIEQKTNLDCLSKNTMISI